MEDKKVPAIPDNELYTIDNSELKKRDIDFNFRVLQEKINQIVEKINITPEETNMMLQQDLLKQGDKIDELRTMIVQAQQYIIQNSFKIGKFNVIIEENNELEHILKEKVEL